MHTNNEILVQVTPSSRWGVSKNLQSLWEGQTTLWFGNSSFPFEWIPQDEKIEVPHLQGLPASVYAIYRGNKPRLGPVVAVLVADYLNGQRPFSVQTKFITELAERARTRGVMVYAITPNNTLASGSLEGYSLVAGQWVKQQLPYPDFIYNRYFGNQSGRRDQMIKQLTRQGALLINSQFPNKWIGYLWLKNDSVLVPHLPETRLYKSTKDISALLSRYPEVYLKPRGGSRGVGIVRLSRISNHYKLVSSAGTVQKLFSLKQLPSYITTDSYIVQQGIRLWNSPRFYDLKVLVQNTGLEFVVTGKVARQAQSGRVTTHLHQGGEALLLSDFLQKLPSAWQSRVEVDIDRIALRTAQVLSNRLERLGEFSLDMGLDEQGRVWIIEVNGKPSRKSFRVVGDLKTRGDAYDRLIDYILHDYIHLNR